MLVFSFLFLFSLTVNSCSLPFTRYDGLDGEEDESDTVGMRSGRVDCSLIWASCGVLEFCPRPGPTIAGGGAGGPSDGQDEVGGVGHSGVTVC